MIIALQTLIFFRESLLAVLDRWLPPLLSQLFLKFSRSGLMIVDDGSEDQVFADFDDQQGVVFVPPVYAQRYAAVCDCLMDERWLGKIKKVVNMGKHHDMAFIKYLTEVPGISDILGVDIDCSLHCSSDLLNLTFENFRCKRDKSLAIMLLRGNAADPDYRLIGCDAVVAIEMIEYMLPHDLDRLVHNLFGFVKPWIAVFTTPNADFNVLFKNLEKNGLRRSDHYFEWTRAQLHDWCSNIVARYPQYTVSCRGVGPGPPGTSHYGCSSQLVLFVSRDYQKQRELNVNSLALVANLPQPNQISDFICGLESPSSLYNPTITCGHKEDSYAELQFPGYCSCHSFLSPSKESVVRFENKGAQCNLESELGKSFVMFNLEEMYEVVRPRRRAYNRVYVIEDVASRLNNTMFEVKKFSKTTQNMMAENIMDSLVHTREVLEEITHLTKMLNFNRLNQGDENYTWCNINWGENAPYWNQYYKVMAVYNYPYEEKDEDSLILDLICDEINKLLDTEYDDGTAVQVSKLEIPIQLLMTAVKHITEDVGRVIALLEYNGYEIDGEVLVYSRIVDGSVASHDDDWMDENFSDGDTMDINSTSMSEGSNAVFDVNAWLRILARYLRRALDRKVRKLRTMFTRDEDITKELNKVACRLLKIALSSRNRHVPIRSKWLQCKMLDLLTLTEKAVVRRKIKFIEDYPLKALGYESQDEATSEMTELCRIKEDDTAMRIVEKYRHLVQAPDTNVDNDGNELEDDFNDDASQDYFRNDPMEARNSTEYVNDLQKNTLHEKENSSIPERNTMLLKYDADKINRTQNWVNVNEEPVLPAYAESINCLVSSGDDHSYCKGQSERTKSRRKLKRKKPSKNKPSFDISLSKVLHTKKSASKPTRDTNFKVRNSKTNTSMKAKTSYKNLFKKLKNKAISPDNKKIFEYNRKFNTIVKPNVDLYPSPIMYRTNIARPIPGSIIKLCHPEHIAQMHFQEQKHTLDEVPKIQTPMAATQDSLLVQIVTQDEQETIALQRSVGTDPEVKPEEYEQELEITNVADNDDTISCNEKLLITTENVHSQTIFLYDINEPSTSKGVRHVSMDVQCGTDVMATNFATLSAPTSLTTLPKMFSNGIKIGDSSSDVRGDKTSDFGTCTNDAKYCMSPRSPSVGIKIKDSETRLRNSLTDLTNEITGLITDLPNERRLVVSREPSGQINIEESNDQYCEGTPLNNPIEKELHKENLTVTETLKQVSSHLKMDSCSEFNSSFGSLPKAPLSVRFAQDEKNPRSSMPRFPTSKYVRPKLSCGGVHVHSYADRQASEDVVYLGEWQKFRPKPAIRKKPYNVIVIAKRSKELAMKKTAFASKSSPQPRPKREIINRSPREVTKQVRCNKMTKVKDELKNKEVKKPPTEVKIQKPPLRSYQNSTKVSTKITMGNVPKKKKSNTTMQCVRRTKSVPPVIKKDSNKSLKNLKKTYIPLYLRRITKQIEERKALQSKLKAEDLNSKKPKEEIQLEIEPDDNKTDLLQVYEPRENVSYVVFRNEIDNGKNGSALGETTISVRPNDRSNSVQRRLSPSSPSSSCSSHNSMATVRAVPAWPRPLSSKHHSTPNAKSNVSRNGSENKMSSRGRKFKNIIATKKDSDKDVNNKENVPESSNEEATNDQILAAGLIGTKGNIFTGNPLSDNFQASNKSSVKIPFVNIVESKHKPGVSDENDGICSTGNSNTILLIESGQPESVTGVSSDSLSSQESFRIVDNNVLSEWIASPNRNIVDNHTSNILAAMKQLVEESLDFVEISDSYGNIDTETIVLSREGSIHETLNEISQSRSKCFKTVETHESDTFYSTFEGVVLDNGGTRSLSVDDTDLLSFKSAPSASGFSECFADIESIGVINAEPSNSCAVRDIFERKETVLTQNPGILAVQAFSGFSMNMEPVGGDQPDYVNLIDSETGSAAYDTARFATSEEVFISGRSSGSFVSCFVDEDSVVPNWLFQIISQQHSGILSLPPEAHLVDQDPLQYEADFDENGNETALAVGAGAGDGRGIHSDQSQDSSGRGSSLSSSDTSSGPHSEAIIIDPSAFIAQFELLREASAPIPIAPTPDLGPSARTTPYDAQPPRSPTGDQQQPRRTNPATSDVDADVSSIDTDVPSDN